MPGHPGPAGSGSADLRGGYSYICPKAPGLEDLIRRFVGNRTATVPSPTDVPEDIIKVSAYCPGNTLAAAQAALSPKWGRHFQVAVAGAEWLDFTLADKGTGLSQLCRALDISLEDVIAFGDNYNDLPMLECAGHPYLMENAAPELKARVSTHCQTMAEILETL